MKTVDLAEMLREVLDAKIRKFRREMSDTLCWCKVDIYCSSDINGGITKLSISF